MSAEPSKWHIKVHGPAQRALSEHLPLGVAMAALEFIQHVLPANPYRVGGELSGRFSGQRSAHLGEYRIIYEIDEDAHVIHVNSIRRRADVYGVG